MLRILAIFIVLLLIGLSFDNASAASAEDPQKHSHEGRIHSHPLPSTGVKHYHKHMHNGRAHIHPYSDKIGFKHSHNLSARAKAWANAIKHEHGGKSHSHPLPNSGIKHQHRHRHGNRSHIHPLPSSGEQHFHDLKKKAPSPKSRVIEKPQTIRNLSIREQMIALLNKPIEHAPQVKTNKKKSQASKTKKKVSKRKKRRIKKSRKKSLRKSSKISNKKRKVVKTQKAPKKITKPTRQTSQQIMEGDRQFNIALRYENGIGINKNLPQAVKWYLRSAKNGNVKAQFNLASMYQYGKGTERNTLEAAKWYKRAAEQGDTKARTNLNELIKDDNELIE